VDGTGGVGYILISIVNRMDIIEIITSIGLLIKKGLIAYLIWTIGQEVIPEANTGNELTGLLLYKL